MNSVLLTGKIATDVFTLATQNGSKKAYFTLSVRGVQSEKCYLRVVFWGDLANTVDKICTKGDMVLVSGYIQYYPFSLEGRKQYMTQIVGRNLEKYYSPKAKPTENVFEDEAEIFTPIGKETEEDTPNQAETPGSSELSEIEFDDSELPF